MSLELIEAHKAELGDIVTLLEADLATQWSTRLSGAASADLALVQREVAELSTELVDYYGSMAAAAGADWYEEMRAEQVRGPFTARTAAPLVREQIDGNVGYALTGLYGAVVDRAAAEAQAQAILRGSLARLALNFERATVLANIQRDPGVTRWYRHAQPDACSFCVTLATREGVYRTREAAQFVVGRNNYGTAAYKAGDIRYGGQITRGARKGQDRTRGTQGYGDKFHDRCRCVPVASYGSATELPDYYEQFNDEYHAARDAVTAAGEDMSTKAILAKMRELTGRK